MKVLFEPYMLLVLVVTLLLYWTVLRDPRHRLLLVTAVSFSLLFWLHSVFAIVVLGAVGFTHFLIKSKRFSHWTLLGVLFAALLILGVGKYDLLSALSRPSDLLGRYFVVPLGISYFVFRWVQYVLDSYRGTIKDPSLLKLAAFIFFFPTVPAGPLETFQGFYGKQRHSFDNRFFLFGLRRIVLGYFKKLFLADYLFHLLFGTFTTAVINGDVQLWDKNPILSLMFVAIMFVWAYLDLAAYTDIAIGLSALFGFRIMENFARPFAQYNLAAFWRSWHISLSQWCRNNVYFPLFGWTRLSWLAVLASMITMGLWHYLNLNWLTWGIYHGLGLGFLIYWQRFKKRHPRLDHFMNTSLVRPFALFLTFWFVALGYAFVAIPDYERAWKVFLTCFRGLTQWG